MKKENLSLEVDRHFTIIIDDIVYDKDLTAYEKLLYVILKTYTNKNTNAVFPSHKKLSDNMNVSVSTVIRAIDGLIEKGYLKKKSGKKGIKGKKDTSNTYTLIEKLPELKEKRLTSVTHHSTEVSTKQTTINNKPVMKKSQVEDSSEIVAPCTDFQYTEKPCPKISDTVKPDTVFSDNNNNNIDLKSTDNNISQSSQSTKKPDKELKEDKTGQDKTAATLKACEELIKENIRYKDLCISYQKDIRFIDELINIILDVVMSKGEYITINKEQKPRALVKSKFMKLDYYEIEQVVIQYKEITTKITKKKQYLLTMLYNVKSELEAGFINDLEPQYR